MLGVVALVSAGVPQDLPRGQVIDDVRCAANPSQSYSLYLPSAYTPERPWRLLVGFHPGARGRAIVEKYRAAAERFGYIVAGSNNSRNGPWETSVAAIQAMSADLGQRFAIDQRRLYMTGHSGGARVALQIALTTQRIAGVIASSAGYPDSRPRASVPFAIFSTAGTEDFNNIELQLLDRALKTPHRLAIFEGGHTLPPDDVAMEAIEWLELQAMASGLRPRDEALIDQLLETRQRLVAGAGESAAAVHLLQSIAADFNDLRDVSASAARAAELAKRSDIKRALSLERGNVDAEARLLDDFRTLEDGLRDPGQRRDRLDDLRALLSRLSRQAGAPVDSPERARARRVLRIVTMGAAERVQDQEYLNLLQRYRPSRTTDD
jgi:dienelactone hydrolase